MPPTTRLAARAAALSAAAAAAASAAEEANRTDCPLLALADGLLESEILRHLPEARDRAALARCCRALRRAASWYEDARVVVAAGRNAAQYGGDPAVSLEQRWRWAGHAAARTRGRLTLAGCKKEDIKRLWGIAACAGFHPRLRELALPNFEAVEEDVSRLRSAVSAGTCSPAAFEKVSVYQICNPDAAWVTRGPAGAPPVLSAEYMFIQVEELEDDFPGRAAAAAALLPCGCDVTILGGNQNEADLPAAVEVTEALAGRQIRRLE